MIPLNIPYLTGKEKQYLMEAIDSGFISGFGGPFIERLKDLLRRYTGAKFAVPVITGTAALHLAYVSAGIGEGDFVIVPDITFVATVNALLYVRAVPVFVDVDPNHWMMDPNRVEDKVRKLRKRGKRVKAIVPVHLFGHPAPMKEILEIAERYDITVVEDAAQGLGTLYSGKMAGTFGKVGIYSFNGNKLITAGQGGAVVTDDEKIAEKVWFLTNQAKDTSSPEFFHPEMGFNYRMPNINAAIACAQLEQIEDFIRRKHRIAKVYMRELGDIPGISFQELPRGDRHRTTWWFFSIKIDEEKVGKTREEIMKALKSKGIGCRPMFMPMHRMPYLKKFAEGETFPVADSLHRSVINVASYTGLRESDVEVVCDSIKEVVLG